MMGEFALVKNKLPSVVEVGDNQKALHKECGNRLKVLEDGRLMCEHCMKVGWPIPAD